MATYSYAPHPEQRLRITLPLERGDKKVPVAVLIHGGYWKQQWTIDNTPITSIVPDLLAKGFGVVELEYRRRDDEGGGWPNTNADVLLAINSLPATAPGECASLDLSNVTLIGHSAGGCLALWLAAQDVQIRIRLVVAVAPVCDLNEGFYMRLSDEGDAIEKYMRCTPDTDEGLAQYALASPAELVPRIQAPLLLAVGTKDADVPPQTVLDFYEDCISERGADTPTRLLHITDADHLNIITSGSVGAFISFPVQFAVPLHPLSSEQTFALKQGGLCGELARYRAVWHTTARGAVTPG